MFDILGGLLGSVFSGSSEKQTEIPDWLREFAQDAIQRTNDTANIGYVPYYGPDVAALNPLEVQAMQSNQDARKAFGMSYKESDPLAQVDGMTAPIDASQYANPEQAQAIADAYKTQLGRDPDQAGFDFWMDKYNPETFANDFAAGTRIDPLTGLTMPGTYAGGVRGYSAAPMFEQSMQELKARRPGQYDAINSFFLDPYTGTAGGGGQAAATQQQNPNYNASDAAIYGSWYDDHFAGHGGPGGFGDPGGPAFGGFFNGPSERW